jgi:hypothetical protein
MRTVPPPVTSREDELLHMKYVSVLKRKCDHCGAQTCM